MPQITLECTNNILEKNLTMLLIKIHQILSEKLPTEVQGCKSRVVMHNDYVIGNGEPNNAFVYLSVGVLKGRSPELLDNIGTILLDKLKDAFQLSSSKLNLQIVVSIQNLPDVYKKIQSK